MRLALVTAAGYPQLLPDDADLLEAALEADLDTDVVAWDDPTVDWSRFDRILPRVSGRFPSSEDWWDWVDRPEVNPRLLGFPRVGCQNLYGLAHYGRLPLVPLSMRLFEDEVIVHSCSGGVGAPRLLVRRNEPESVQAAEAAGIMSGRWLAREVCPELWTDGEVSVVLFGGVFSHAVRRTPLPGTVGMTEALGATVTPTIPSAELLAFAEKRRLDDALIQRIDILRVAGRFRIMMFCDVDADLFFRYTTGGEARLMAAVKNFD